MYIKQILDEFKSFGIKMINPQIGEEFNPQLHEAIDWNQEVEKNRHITKVISPGFTLHERVIKPVKVIVGK